MEVNGRYWGSLYLPIRAGLNFPLYEWQLAHGISPRVPTSYPAGLRVRWTGGALGLLARSLDDGAGMEAESEWPIPVPGRPQSLRGILSYFQPNVRSALASLRDPLPSLYDALPSIAAIGRACVKRFVRSWLPRPAARVSSRQHARQGPLNKER
jgi:hypothetical protein